MTKDLLGGFSDRRLLKVKEREGEKMRKIESERRRCRRDRWRHGEKHDEHTGKNEPSNQVLSKSTCSFRLQSSVL